MLTKQETNAYIEKYIFKPALVAEKYDAELSKMIDDWKKKCKIRKAKNETP